MSQELSRPESEASSPPVSATSPDETVQKRRRRIHWKTGVGIVLGGLIAEIFFLNRYSGESTMQVYATFVIALVIGPLLLLWWTVISGFSRLARVTGIGVAAGMFGLFFLVFRVDHFVGDMVPQLAFRWSPQAEAASTQYWTEQWAAVSAPKTSESPVVAGETRTLQITQDDWPHFRGPDRDGVVRGFEISRDWSAHPPRLLWKHQVGPAWSSFAVVGGLALTQEQNGNEEFVVCYDFETGKPVWVHTDPVRYATAMGGTGPRATPTVFESRVYALGATGILNCLDPFTGELFWTTNILEDASVVNLDWAMAGSPLVFDDKVVVNPGGAQGGGVAAYDRLTGRRIWANGSHPASYVSARLETIQGAQQILIYDGDGVAGYDPADGTELWRSEQWTNVHKINAAQPIVRDERLVLISSGYGVGSMLYEVLFETGAWSVKQKWSRKAPFRLKFNDAVYRDGYVYGLDDGILACIEYSTGKRQWKRGRYRFGQVLLIDDLLLVTAESGHVALVEASPLAFREITRFKAIDGMTWNQPVVARGRLLIRNAEEAACFDLRPTEK